MQTQKTDSQGGHATQSPSKAGDFDHQSNELINQIIEVFNLGCIMKAVLMEPEGIKAVEKSVEIINKMNEKVLLYQGGLESVTKLIQSTLATRLGEEKLQQVKLEYKKIQNMRSKQSNLQANQNDREQMIENMANHLFNAKKNLQVGQEQGPSDAQPLPLKNVLKLEKQQSHVIIEPQIDELKKIVSNLENEGKIHKKLLEDSTRSILEKEEKISNLKVTISKMEEHIIRQVKQQSETSSRMLGDGESSSDLKNSHLNFKNSSNEPSLIRSQALQREVFQLRKQIQNLRTDLCKSVEIISQKEGQLLRLSTRFNVSQQTQKQKKDQFTALSKQYASVRQEVIQFLNQIKQSKPNPNDMNQSFISDSSDEQEINQLSNLKTDYYILQEKYNRLQLTFEETKKQAIRFSSLEPPMMKKSSQMSLSSPKEPPETDNLTKHGSVKQKSKNSYNTPRVPKNKTIKRVENLEYDEMEQIKRDFKQMNSFQRLKEAMKSLNLENLVNVQEMNSKIQGFDYSASIIHKINSSKFIHSFEAKISFILQYVCLLEIYFGKKFLSCLRQQLMMQDRLTIKPLSTEDLNQTYLISPQIKNDSSFVSSSNHSKMMSSSKMIINSQYSINEYSNANNNASLSITMNKQQTGHTVSLSNPNSPKVENQSKSKIKKLQGQILELSSIISDSKPNLKQISEDPQLFSRLQKLKENPVAKMITGLTKENQIFKKCLSQMIKNEQNFTKLNNQIYFDESGQMKRRSTNAMKPEENSNRKRPNQNCGVM